MSIIVEVKTSRKKYYLLGAGLGMYRSSRTSYLGGNLLPIEVEGITQSIAVCDETGEIYFMDKSSLRVVEIDGLMLSEMAEKLNDNVDNNYGKD